MQLNEPSPLVYSLAQVTELLGISRPSLRKLIRERKDFPVFHVGRRTLADADGLREWIRRQAVSDTDNKN